MREPTQQNREGLLDGEQLKYTSLWLYFSEMRFKYESKHQAIQERERGAEFNR